MCRVRGSFWSGGPIFPNQDISSLIPIQPSIQSCLLLVKHSVSLLSMKENTVVRSQMQSPWGTGSEVQFQVPDAREGV
jgi:hypothetical protein